MPKIGESLDPEGHDLALTEPTNPTALFRDLEKTAQRLSKRQGEILFRRGEEPIGVFLIFQGSVILELEGAAASRCLGPGSILGLPGCLSAGSYSLTAEAAEACVLGFLPRSELLQKLSATPELCFQVMQILSDEIAHSRRVAEEVLSISPRRKPTSA